MAHSERTLEARRRAAERSRVRLVRVEDCGAADGIGEVDRLVDLERRRLDFAIALQDLT